MILKLYVAMQRKQQMCVNKEVYLSYSALKLHHLFGVSKLSFIKTKLTFDLN